MRLILGSWKLVSGDKYFDVFAALSSPRSKENYTIGFSAGFSSFTLPELLYKGDQAAQVLQFGEEEDLENEEGGKVKRVVNLEKFTRLVHKESVVGPGAKKAAAEVIYEVDVDKLKCTITDEGTGEEGTAEFEKGD